MQTAVQSEVQFGHRVAPPPPNLGEAAAIFAKLRETTRKANELAWLLDSKAAMIRRRQNGNNAFPNGTADEQHDLALTLELAKDHLAKR